MQNYQINSTAGTVVPNGSIFYRRMEMDAQLLFDAPRKSRTRNDKLVLERHFNDLYAVFLHKLTAFALKPGVSKAETERLRTFFDELLKAREILDGEEAES